MPPGFRDENLCNHHFKIPDHNLGPFANLLAVIC
jgi:hypothetical protein